MPDLDEKTVKKLKKLFAVMDEDTLTRAQFVESFENVVNLVLKVEKKNSDFIDEAKQMIENIKTHVRGLSEEDFKGLKSDMLSEVGMLSAKLDTQQKQIEQKMAQLRDGLDGVSPDVDEVARAAAELIKLPEYRAPIMDGPQEIRDKLETLQGTERLKIDAIDALREELDALKARPTGRGGGTSAMGVAQAFKYILKTEQPVGDIDSANLTYTLKQPIFAILSMSINGETIAQLPNYTIKGKTFTFATALPSAYSGKDWEVKYI
jgi:hypothetical protein